MLMPAYEHACVRQASGLEERMAVEVEKIGPGEWRTHDRKGREIRMRYDNLWILVTRPRKRLKSEVLLRKLVYNAFGQDLPDWYVEMVMETVVDHPGHAQLVLNTVEAKQMMDQADQLDTEPATVTSTADRIEDPLDDLMAHVLADERPQKSAPIGHMTQPAMLLITDKRILWRFIEPGSPVLTLMFSEIREVNVDEGRGVKLTYRPVDLPDEGSEVNPNGQWEAEFIFQRGNEDVRQMVLGRARREVELRSAGATLASGVGYLSGVSDSEQYDVDVEAHESGLVIYLGALPMWICSYSAATSFAVDPVPEGLKASERLGVGSPAVWLSLAGEGVQDRWRLVVKPDDLERWRVILEQLGIRDARRS
jgi:hypothetical protein